MTEIKRKYPIGTRFKFTARATRHNVWSVDKKFEVVGYLIVETMYGHEIFLKYSDTGSCVPDIVEIV